MRRALLVLVVLSLVVTACTPATEGDPTTTTVAGSTSTAPAVETSDPGFYLNLVWHQHQPFYPKDDEGVYTRPWVRVHATKDYWDMAAMIERYPDISVTFNLTPVLLLQLEDLATGAKDAYWVAAEVPASDLTEEDRRFVVERFFDVNPKIVARFARFQELADSRAELGVDGAVASWSDDDLRDLQVLFNLAWTDPFFLSQEPLAALVSKGRDFAEEDKAVLFAEHLRIIQEVIPLHARLWEEGVIEVTTTPLAHPILPLISDTNLALVGDPAAVMPENRFQEIPDADEQVIRGLDVAERLLGRRPTGMWPGEGAVAQLVMSLFSKNGVRWVATGEDVLAKTLDIGSFTRDGSDTVEQASTLYRPWAAQLRRNDPVTMFFRDNRISDQIGFEYSGSSAEAAAGDFMSRLEAIYESVDVQSAIEAGRPYVVSVILDGENAWEHYENDGIDFLDALYTSISEADWVQTITPSEYLDRFGEPEALPDVFPASWFQPNYATWIGEEEEALAWDYLYRTRQDLREAEDSGVVPEAALAEAFETMLFAEGSDWFWWYGSDQESGDDGYFDRAFRELLGQVYDRLGMERPAFVGVPIIAAPPVEADRAPDGLLTIEIDGDLADWETSGVYRVGEESAFLWAFDRENLYLGWSGGPGDGTADPVSWYLGAQGPKTAVTYEGLPLGFGATHAVVWDGEAAGVCDPAGDYHPEKCLDIPSAAADGGVEVAVPLEDLGALTAGDVILAKAVEGGAVFPEAGPMAFQVPDISNVEVFLDVEDPLGDDHGPGSYTYPTDPVFIAGSYDLTRFQVGTEGDDLVFTFEVDAPVRNPWNSPRGLSIQTFDVYVDTDPGAATGARLLLPGRNASLEEGNGWEYGFTLEGWFPALYVAGPDGSSEETEPTFDTAVFADAGRVVARLPLSLFGDGDPSTWAYSAVVLSQEGFPSSGVRRVRDVDVTAGQYRGGGAPGDVNQTRIFDVAWPTQGDQESLLSGYAPASGSIDDLGPDDVGQVPLLSPD